MTRLQRIYLFWLAYRNVQEAIEKGDGDRMFRYQKRVRRELGWRFYGRSAGRMIADLEGLPDLLEADLPASDTWPEF